MLDGYTRCNNYTRKNLKTYDRVFSKDELNALTAKYNRLAEAARWKSEEIKSLLAKATRVQLAIS